MGGRRVRCLGAGSGEALVQVGGDLTPAHDLLARGRRVIVLDGPDLHPPAVLGAASALGIDAFDLLATAAGADIAQQTVLTEPGRVRALVLESPAARPMPAVGAPVLVVVGTEAGPTAAETGRAFRRELPNCHLVFVYAAGPAVARQRPEAFVEVVSDFLERHEQFIVSRRDSALLP